MATRTLLNEAIAEAESIREAALANAKAALEESFAPHIKEMFSKKVQELDEDEKIEEMKGKKHDKEELEEMDAPSYDRKSGPSITPAPEKVGKSTVQEEEEVELDALLAQLDEEMDSEIEEGYGKKGEEDLDEAKHSDDDEKIDEGEKAKEDEKHLHEEEEGEVDAEAEVDADDDPDIDLEEMSEEDLMDLIRDVIDELEAKGEIEADGGEEADAEIEIEDDMMEGKHEEEEMKEGVGKFKIRKPKGMSEGEDEDIDEGVGKFKIRKPKGISEEEDVEEGVGKWNIKKPKGMSEGDEHDDEKAMEEALAEINKLKADLQEVNLLNAKLLYANKIFRNKNLSESQKVKVLESFDKANTVKEAKIVFETLSEGITTRERRRPTRQVKGSASAATNVIKENKQPIVESNDMVARFQKLAGIK
jgi:pilus assembly protein FimV